MSCNLPRNSVASNRFMKTQGVKNKFKFLLGGICCLIFLLLSVLSIPVYMFRILAVFLAKLLRPDLGDILNGLSSVLANDYFYNSNSPRTNIVFSLVTHGRDISPQEIKKVFLERWIRAKDKSTGKLTFQKFQQYPVRWMGFTFWKNCMDTFSINNHVFFEDQNDADVVDDEKLNNICEKLLNAPYLPNRSPWEVHLVKNYKCDQLEMLNKSEDQTTHVILFKLHHCLADGYSMLNAVVEGLGQHYLTNVKLAVPTVSKKSLWENVTCFISFPLNAFYEFSYVLSHVFHSSPWKVPDNEKKWYQFCAKSNYFPIQKIKFIKSQLQISFSSIFISAISSAIYQNLNNQKQKKVVVEELKKRFQNTQDDGSMYFLNVLPLPGHSRRLTNHCTAALFDLPIHKYKSSLDRLHDVDNILESKKNTSLPSIIPLYYSVVGCHFYPVGRLLGVQRMAASGLTNFPGVLSKIEIFESKLVAADFVVGSLDGVEGVRIMVLSYGDNIRVAVAAEKAVMTKDDANRFVKSVINEIDLIHDLAMTKNSAKKLAMG